MNQLLPGERPKELFNGDNRLEGTFIRSSQIGHHRRTCRPQNEEGLFLLKCARTSKWFRSLLSSKKPPPEAASPAPAKEKKKSKCAPSKSANNSGNLKNVENPSSSPYVDGLDTNKHAIAVAAATAAVAEAALAAAQAAAEVVRLTSSSGSGRSAAAYVSSERRRVAAAIKIQSAFRAYLARRALRALKGLVKLQALVRGHIVRKQSADMLRRMQAMARIQARASANRAYTSEIPSSVKIKFPNSRHHQRSNSSKHGGSTVKQNNTRPRNSGSVNKEGSSQASNWLDHWMEHCAWNSGPETSLELGRGDDERADKILEIDTWKPHQNSRRNDRTLISSSHLLSASKDMGQEYPKLASASRLSAKLHKPNPSISSEDVSSIRSSKFHPEGDQVVSWTADNSPRVHSASPRTNGNQRGPFTPAKSECSRSMFGDYLGYPNYMLNTESSRAKFRSQSTPKQRMQLEELSSGANFTRSWDFDGNLEKGFPLPSNYRNNGYVYNGHLKSQLGDPTRGATGGFSSTYGRRL